MSRLLLTLCVSAIVLAVPSVASAAEVLYGVTNDNELVTINSSAPGNVERSVPLAGQQPGENIVGLDVRPLNDALYALGSTSRIYRVIPASGTLRPVGAAPFVPALAGASFGFDFNPTVDRIRVTSDTEQNLRLNPDTGATTATDTALAYAAGDAGAGTNPSVGAVAYTNSVAGATTTELYGIDSARDTLVLQNPPNAGTLNTRGALGVAVEEANSFDIGTGNVGYAALGRQGEARSLLYTINLATGRATATSPSPGIGGGGRLRALAAAGTAPDDNTDPRLSVASSSTQLESRLLGTGLFLTVNCNEACAFTASATVAGRTGAGTTPGAVVDRAGSQSVTLRFNAAARARIRRAGTVALTLTVRVRDTAGNLTTLTRAIRSRIG